MSVANHSSTPVPLLPDDSLSALPVAWFEGFEQCLPWLEPLADASCGPNLEYSNEFLELQSTALGRVENQFQAAEEPDWKQVQRLSETLLSRTRDLRILVLWMHAQLQLRGLSGLLPALALMCHWCQHHWGQLNPPLDGQDPFERINAMEALSQGEAFLSALKRTEVMTLPMMGAVEVRQFAYALDKAKALNPSESIPRPQLESALQMQLAQALQIRALVQNIQSGFKRLSLVLAVQLPDQALPDFHPVLDLLNNVLTLLPRDKPVLLKSASVEIDEVSTSSEGAVLAHASNLPGFSAGVLRSRQDALRAIEAVCIYLEQAEPTNPAQLLLKRAARLIDKNFLALMKDLAPGALNDVARIMGVDPKEIQGSDY